MRTEPNTNNSGKTKTTHKKFDQTTSPVTGGEKSHTSYPVMSQIFLQGCIEGGDSMLTSAKKITSTIKSSTLKQLLRKRKITHVPITIVNKAYHKRYKDTPKKKVRSEMNQRVWMYYQVCILDKHFQKNIILALHSLYQVNLTNPFISKLIISLNKY